MPDRSDERKRSRTDSDSEVDDPFSNRRDRKIAASEAMDSTSNKPSKKSRSLVPGSSNGAVAPGSHAATAASIARFHDICNLDDSVDLPDYVKQHANTLTFPEKVSRLAVQMCDVLQLWTVSFVSNLLLLIPLGAANADAHACRESSVSNGGRSFRTVDRMGPRRKRVRNQGQRSVLFPVAPNFLRTGKVF